MSAIIYLDLARLKKNFGIVKKIANNSKIMSVIKTNAYGHNILKVAKSLSGSDAFAVAEISEAKILRKNYIKKRIICLQGFENIKELNFCKKNKIEPVIHNEYQLREVARLKKKSFENIWIKFNTGMNRLGFDVKEANNIFKKIYGASEKINLMTHFSDADEKFDKKTNKQLRLFNSILSTEKMEKSLSNSAGILKYDDSHSDWVRPGLLLYGINLTHKKITGLKPVMKVTAKVIATRKCKKGDEIGYGSTYKCKKSEYIAALSIGYGDGLPRSFSNNGKVFFKGKKFSIVGRISMDITTISSGNNQLKIGDELEIWGDNISVEDISSNINTIPYELLCNIKSKRKINFSN